LSDRTRVVAFPWASNAIGTIVDAKAVCELAHQAGALAWIDAVHYAAHEPIDVAAVGADVLICSPYKFCGPHLGMAFVGEPRAARGRPDRARPPPAGRGGRRCGPGPLRYALLAGLTAASPSLDALGGLPALRP